MGAPRRHRLRAGQAGEAQVIGWLKEKLMTLYMRLFMKKDQ